MTNDRKIRISTKNFFQKISQFWVSIMFKTILTFFTQGLNNMIQHRKRFINVTSFLCNLIIIFSLFLTPGQIDKNYFWLFFDLIEIFATQFFLTHLFLFIIIHVINALYVKSYNKVRPGRTLIHDSLIGVSFG